MVSSAKTSNVRSGQFHPFGAKMNDMEADEFHVCDIHADLVKLWSWKTFRDASVGGHLSADQSEPIRWNVICFDSEAGKLLFSSPQFHYGYYYYYYYY